jgi:hypothetical protein
VIRWAHQDRLAGIRATAVSALEILVVPHLQGRGIAQVMLTALRDNARRLGFAELYAPLRPTDKHREPLTPFAEYVARRRADGLPHDSWVRTHLRVGARIIKGGTLQYGCRRHPCRMASMINAAAISAALIVMLHATSDSDVPYTPYGTGPE